MKIFFTSDWHIGHENVIQFSNRPFKDLEHMHSVLINNYNSTVGELDTCYFLGDMGLTSGDEIRNVVEQLNGTKILVLGNHDKNRHYMYNLGFDVVLNAVMLDVAGRRLTATHCPLVGVPREDVSQMKGSQKGENWHGEFRAKAYKYCMPDFGQFHLHGHIHSPNHGKSNTILDRQWDVGVDGNNYRPVGMKQVESWIASYE